MSCFFHKKKSVSKLFYHTDLHSHIIPAVDDGAQSIETSLDLLRAFRSWGIDRIYATPHVCACAYENTPESIEPPYRLLCEKASEAGIGIDIRYSAEYRMDENFRVLLQQESAAFKPLPGGYLLIENSFMQAPLDIDELIFQIQLKGLRPVLAHPERYRYYHHNKESYKILHQNGCLFQVNLLSLSGYYSKEVKEVAWWLGKNGMVDFLGSDLHHIGQAEAITAWLMTKEYRKATETLKETVLNDRISYE